MRFYVSESWNSTNTNVNPTTDFRTYLDASIIEIKNLPKFNGKYISNYTLNDNFINKTQKELVVYYVGLTNKCRIKITYFDFYSKVSIECAK